jgi:hypothetical protein
MASTKYQPLTVERLDALRRDPDVVYHRRTEDSVTPFVSELRVAGYIDILELLGCRDEVEIDEGVGDTLGAVNPV